MEQGMPKGNQKGQSRLAYTDDGTVLRRRTNVQFGANTLEYRRLMSTQEALATCNMTKASEGCLGSQDLRKILDKDKGLNRTTCHEEECIYVDGEFIGFVWRHTTC